MSINDEKKLAEEASQDKHSKNRHVEKTNLDKDKEFEESDEKIVSVNDRGDQEDGMGKKIAFIVVIAIILIVAIIFGINKYRNNKAEKNAENSAKNAPNPELAASNKKRDFSSTDPDIPNANATLTGDQSNPNANLQSTTTCNDQSVPKQAVDPKGNEIMRNGMHVFVCNDGQQILRKPETSTAQAQPMQQPPQYQPQAIQKPRASRYSGAIFVDEKSGALNAMGSRFDGRTQQAYNQVSNIVRTAEQDNGQGGFGGGQNNFDDGQGQSNQATRANTNFAQLSSGRTQARFIGDRNFLLAKGRVIKCNLSTRVVSEISGMASCVIPQPVYSENGKVVLAEAGSEVLGEYKSISTQGQRRLHILWTRLKTPNGVIVDLDSPASDALGTAGISGKVDNRWGSRIGAAFMLSLVQDAVAYGIAKETEGTNQQFVLQNTSETGKSMSEKVLENTINIKPTIFTRQGDITSIYVAKDIDFRSVYELKAK